MNIEYRIIRYHKPTASVQVNYFNADIPDGVMFSLNLPVVEGQLPQGPVLEAFILQHAPRDMFERAASLREAEVPAELAAVSTTPGTPPQSLMDDQFFVREGGERILMVRPLVQLYSLDVPVEII